MVASKTFGGPRTTDNKRTENDIPACASSLKADGHTCCHESTDTASGLESSKTGHVQGPEFGANLEECKAKSWCG